MNQGFDHEEIPTYEEVAKLYPRPSLHRQVVLIGPPGVGRNEFKRWCMAVDGDKYKTTVQSQLSDNDFHKRLQFCEWGMRKVHKQRSWSVNVWFGLFHNKIIGPYFVYLHAK
ncbi:hypothetical protein WN51_07008 [Melipona quadrifasciata]|uniref:Guanylate kinase-like domain-containing protein n=1 Tax=Melipona quadrifasciata TaxID=166423 RepID=A0A0M8ZQ51_9HYME|nr:hypothetical protein WN51_07008 [Melipona quadrifasciata]